MILVKFCLLILTIILFFGFFIIKFFIVRKVWNYISLINESSLLLGFFVVKYSIAWFLFLKNVFKGFDIFFCNKNSRYFVKDFCCGFVRIDLCFIRRLYIFNIFIGIGFAILKDVCNCWLS